MTLADALTALYAVSGLAAALCYGPQLRRLWRDAPARRAMSVASWAGWLAVSVVTVLYGALVVGAAEMVAVAAINAGCQAAVLALAAGQRIADRRVNVTALSSRRQLLVKTPVIECLGGSRDQKDQRP